MSVTIEELPLLRAKARGITSYVESNPNVGPGSFSIPTTSVYNHPHAPFDSTSERFPTYHNDTNIHEKGKSTYVTEEENSDYISANIYTFSKRGITSCPFRSDALRFVAADCTSPGPGSYELVNNWADKRKPRAHLFRQSVRNCNNEQCPSRDHENDNLYPEEKVNIANKKECDRIDSENLTPHVSHFAKYSTRQRDTPTDNPGPGAYEVNLPAKSLYTAKPSHMFATKTSRSTMVINDNPGPGAYSVHKSTLPQNLQSETFSAFNSSAPRFISWDKENSPGPGEYTGNIAPRRPWELTRGFASTSFGSTAERFTQTISTPLGPGMYDSIPLHKRCHFSKNQTFGSTTPRFSTYVNKDDIVHNNNNNNDAEESSRFSSIRIPRRIPRRNSSFAKTMPIPHKPNDVVNEPNHNISYNWTKPCSKLKTTFGTEPRFRYCDKVKNDKNYLPFDHNINTATYKVDDSKRIGKSNWSKAARFVDASSRINDGLSEFRGPGEYYKDTTFLTKTFNTTIGEDPS